MESRMLLKFEDGSGRIFGIGTRVRHNDGWTGSVAKIRQLACGLIKLHVAPDRPPDVPGRTVLNESFRARLGREDYIEARDHGQTAGNFDLLVEEKEWVR